MKKLKLYTTALGIILLSASAANASDNTKCTSFSNTMTKKAVDIFHDTKSSEQQKKMSLAKLFDDTVDTDWIGQFVLGRYWKDSSAGDQKEYLETYSDYLTMTYISKFKEEQGFGVDNIKLVRIVPLEAKRFEAKTLIQREGEADMAVDFMLEEMANDCRVHDIKIEGVSLLSTQRSEFQTIGRSSGIKGVTAAMKKRLAASK